MSFFTKRKDFFNNVRIAEANEKSDTDRVIERREKRKENSKIRCIIKLEFEKVLWFCLYIDPKLYIAAKTELDKDNNIRVSTHIRGVKCKKSDGTIVQRIIQLYGWNLCMLKDYEGYMHLLATGANFVSVALRSENMSFVPLRNSLENVPVNKTRADFKGRDNPWKECDDLIRIDYKKRIYDLNKGSGPGILPEYIQSSKKIRDLETNPTQKYNIRAIVQCKYNQQPLSAAPSSIKLMPSIGEGFCFPALKMIDTLLRSPIPEELLQTITRMKRLWYKNEEEAMKNIIREDKKKQTEMIKDAKLKANTVTRAPKELLAEKEYRAKYPPHIWTLLIENHKYLKDISKVVKGDEEREYDLKRLHFVPAPYMCNDNLRKELAQLQCNIFSNYNKEDKFMPPMFVADEFLSINSWEKLNDKRWAYIDDMFKLGNNTWYRLNDPMRTMDITKLWLSNTSKYKRFFIFLSDSKGMDHGLLFCTSDERPTDTVYNGYLIKEHVPSILSVNQKSRCCLSQPYTCVFVDMGIKYASQTYSTPLLGISYNGKERCTMLRDSVLDYGSNRFSFSLPRKDFYDIVYKKSSPDIKFYARFGDNVPSIVDIGQLSNARFVRSDDIKVEKWPYADEINTYRIVKRENIITMLKKCQEELSVYEDCNEYIIEFNDKDGYARLFPSFVHRVWSVPQSKERFRIPFISYDIPTEYKKEIGEKILPPPIVRHYDPDIISGKKTNTLGDVQNIDEKLLSKQHLFGCQDRHKKKEEERKERKYKEDITYLNSVGQRYKRVTGLDTTKEDSKVHKSIKQLVKIQQNKVLSNKLIKEQQKKRKKKLEEDIVRNTTPITTFLRVKEILPTNRKRTKEEDKKNNPPNKKHKPHTSNITITDFFAKTHINEGNSKDSGVFSDTCINDDSFTEAGVSYDDDTLF